MLNSTLTNISQCPQSEDNRHRLTSVFLSQDEVEESDVDPHFKSLFKQIAGNVCTVEEHESWQEMK